MTGGRSGVSVSEIHPEHIEGDNPLRLLVAPVVTFPADIETGSPNGVNLRRILGFVDLLALATSWWVALAVTGSSWLVVDPARCAVVVAAALVVSLSLVRLLGLYRSRVCTVRSVEVARLGRVAAMTAVVPLIAPAFGLVRDVPLAIALALGHFVFLTAARGAYAGWLRGERAKGRFVRPVVVVGTDDDAAALCNRLARRPELGVRVVGVVGDAISARERAFPVPWVGPAHLALQSARSSGATGAIVSTSELPAADRTSVVNALVDGGLHVQVALGITGVDHRRLRPLHLDHEPLLYVEPVMLGVAHQVAKRALDLVLGVAGTVLALPLLAAAAVAIKLDDRGPVLFRQDRVGKDGRLFTVYKLRTMVPGAERQLAHLRDRNNRDGPLFKLADDPRVTAVGRFLRATSIDELPQLVNVLRGEMSLVGPRPALPYEVEQFDSHLLGRLRMRPGITGLWQVEARDDVSFDAYRRLDLFYVENWSIGLDLVVLGATVGAVLRRVGRAVRPAAVASAGALTVLD